LVLPAQFPLTPESDSTHFLSQLQHTLSGSLSSSSPTSTPPPSLPADLIQSSYVFVRSPPCPSSFGSSLSRTLQGLAEKSPFLSPPNWFPH
jgi:hypothetical protein